MKKVGILSMQRIFNYGSFLQAYGLKQILTDLGCEVEFVDYHPGECLIPAKSAGRLSRAVSKLTESLRYHAPLREKIKFIVYKMNYAKNNFPLLGIREGMNYSPKVDLLVIGSDEVFNCVQDNTNVGFSPELFGQDSNAGKVITYAASFGNTTLEKLETYNVRHKIAGYLSELAAISVRDKNSGKIVQALTGKEPVYNLDPVLAYDYMGRCSKIPECPDKSDYILLYGYSGRFSDSECRFIKDYAKQQNCKVYCIGGVQNACDQFIDCDPFTVISYFRNAKCVITDTFHGTIMSVITHQRFVSFVRDAGYGNSEKLTDLLERLGQSAQIVSSVEEIPQKLSAALDYTHTDEVIRREREKTYAYLKQQINEV